MLFLLWLLLDSVGFEKFDEPEASIWDVVSVAVWDLASGARGTGFTNCTLVGWRIFTVGFLIAVLSEMSLDAIAAAEEARFCEVLSEEIEEIESAGRGGEFAADEFSAEIGLWTIFPRLIM